MGRCMGFDLGLKWDRNLNIKHMGSGGDKGLLISSGPDVHLLLVAIGIIINQESRIESTSIENGGFLNAAFEQWCYFQSRIWF